MQSIILIGRISGFFLHCKQAGWNIRFQFHTEIFVLKQM